MSSTFATINNGLNGPQFLAFQVPEPSAWAPLGLGVLGAGLLALRRKGRLAWPA